jgi:hypothetical protein
MSGSVVEGHAPVVLLRDDLQPWNGRTSHVLADTTDGPALGAALRPPHAPHPTRFRLVVPARWPSDAVVAMARNERLTGPAVEDVRFVLARWRLRPLVEELRSLGLDIAGDVDLPAPLRVVTKALASHAIHDVLLFGRGTAWSRLGTTAMARRLRRHLPVPVIEI